MSLAAVGQSQGGRATGAPPAIHACTVLPANEVKRLIGLPDPLNLYTTLPPEEQPVGRGSSCNYPNVHVQIDPFDWSTIDAACQNPNRVRIHSRHRRCGLSARE